MLVSVNEVGATFQPAVTAVGLADPFSDRK
jgi:hypothetical protein